MICICLHRTEMHFDLTLCSLSALFNYVNIRGIVDLFWFARQHMFVLRQLYYRTQPSQSLGLSLDNAKCAVRSF